MKNIPEQQDLFDPDFMTPDQVLNAMDPSVREDTRVWPALLSELVDVLADHMETRENKDPEAAMEHAQDIIVVIAHHLGGRNIYLPRDDRLKRAIRDAAIYRAFNGDNHRDLAKKTKLTVAQIYNIISKERTLRQDRNQLKFSWEEK